MAKNLRQFLCIGAFAAASVLAIPAVAQQPVPQDRQDQARPDQDDQNRQANPDQDRVRRDQDDRQAVPQDQRDRDMDRDRGRDTDRDRAGDRDRDRDNVNQQWVNTKAYQQGLKDGEHDRAKNKGERADRRHWKNDQDRQAYEAGYNAGYRGNKMPRNDHDRDDQRR
jgi:hypothetical protein